MNKRHRRLKQIRERTFEHRIGEQHADGSVSCVCSPMQRYSPLAFQQAHVEGGNYRDAEGGVLTMGPQDPWTVAREESRRAEPAQAASRHPLSDEMRADLIEVYHRNQRRGPARIAEGADEGMFGDG